jgi:hypothetical protein
MKIEITHNSKAVRDFFDGIVKKQIPYVQFQTVNDLAFAIKKETQDEMRSTFDRPTPFTLKSMEVIKAKNKQNPSAWVGLNLDPAFQRSLAHQFTGGNRRWKKMEGAMRRAGIIPPGMNAMPGEGASLDQYGNLKGSFVVQLISYFQAFGEQGYKANMTDKRKKQLAKRGKTQEGYVTINGVVYFLANRKGRTKHLHPGIYAKTNIHGFIVKPIIIFGKRATYQRRIYLDRIGQDVFKRDATKLFTQRMMTAIANDRRLTQAAKSSI